MIPLAHIFLRLQPPRPYVGTLTLSTLIFRTCLTSTYTYPRLMAHTCPWWHQILLPCETITSYGINSRPMATRLQKAPNLPPTVSNCLLRHKASCCTNLLPTVHICIPGRSICILQHASTLHGTNSPFMANSLFIAQTHVSWHISAYHSKYSPPSAQNHSHIHLDSKQFAFHSIHLPKMINIFASKALGFHWKQSPSTAYIRLSWHTSVFNAKHIHLLRHIFASYSTYSSSTTQIHLPQRTSPSIANICLL